MGADQGGGFDRLAPRSKPVAAANAAMESGCVSEITLRSALFSSLSTAARERMEVNPIFGSPGLGLMWPFAMASMRARIGSCGKIPIVLACMRFLISALPVVKPCRLP
jgi:hypothetical protein